MAGLAEPLTQQFDRVDRDGSDLDLGRLAGGEELAAVDSVDEARRRT